MGAYPSGDGDGLLKLTYLLKIIMNVNQKGKITELDVLSYITKKGYSVSLPFGDKDRYDQIWDIKGKLYRVQIKTARWLDEEHTGFVFNCYSVSNGKKSVYTKQDIDLFATIVDNQLYIFPVENCSTEKKVRFTSKQNQPSINWAKDCTFEEVLEK